MQTMLQQMNFAKVKMKIKEKSEQESSYFYYVKREATHIILCNINLHCLSF